MKTLLRLSFALLFIVPAQAQYSYSSGGAFSLGIQSIPTAELAMLSPAAPELNATNFSFGGYGVWQFNRYMIGFKGAGIYGSEVRSNNLAYNVQAGYWGLDLGYKVINKDKFGLYPFVGLNYGGLTYSVASTQEYVVRTPTALDMAEFNWSGFLLDIGLRAEHLFGFQQSGEGQGGGLVGLELGYMLAPAGGNWETRSGASVVGAPDYAMDGFYVRLLIGGMGGKKM